MNEDKKGGIKISIINKIIVFLFGEKTLASEIVVFSVSGTIILMTLRILSSIGKTAQIGSVSGGIPYKEIWIAIAGLITVAFMILKGKEEKEEK